MERIKLCTYTKIYKAKGHTAGEIHIFSMWTKRIPEEP